ncbi:hypothetical protein AMTRI_Chr04g184180 [Amborella trichopoda]
MTKGCSLSLSIVTTVGSLSLCEILRERKVEREWREGRGGMGRGLVRERKRRNFRERKRPSKVLGVRGNFCEGLLLE